MAKLDIGALLNGLNTILKGLQDAAPIAEKLGLPPVVANVSTIAIAAMAVIQNVLERGQNAKDMLSSQDEDKLRKMLSELQAVNDKLAGEIAADAAEAGARSDDSGS